MDINLDKHSPVPLGDQLQAQVRLLIVTGTLAPGELLPTVQTLAAATDTNYNTVAAAYRALEAQGYLVQHRRAGTRVAPEPPVSAQEMLTAYLGAEVAGRVHALGLAADDALRLIGAHIALKEVAPSAPHIAVLAGDAAQAAALAQRAEALFGETLTFVAVTPASYRSQAYVATLVAPTLLESLMTDTVPSTAYVPHIPLWPNTYDFPAGAD